jgi:hypothetical protein
MKHQTKLLMVIFGLTLVTSGCVEGGSNESAATEVVSVNEFSLNPNPVPSERQAELRMILENVGDNDAEDVQAKLFNAPINLGGNSWSSSEISEGTADLEFGRLRAATETTTSVPRSDSVTLEAQSVEQGSFVNNEFMAEIFYRYETDADTQISVVSDERFQEEGMTQGTTTTTNSNGPIQIEVQSRTPIIKYNEGEETLSLSVIVRNKGDGDVYMPGTAFPQLNEEDKNKLELTLENSGNIIFDQDRENVTKEVDLINGNEAYPTYEFTVDTTGSLREVSQTIEINAEYSYVTETQTSYTVEGRRN